MTLQELLAELQREYLQTFPAKVTLIEQLWADGSLTELETEYHKMKGTGRTYGLPEVSQLGEAVERLCEIGRDDLPTAVPLSLRVLRRIQESRQRGETLAIENDRDFQVIMQLCQRLRP